jgi:hypothetical protein
MESAYSPDRRAETGSKRSISRRFLNLIAPAAALAGALFIMQAPAESQAPSKAKVDPTAPAGTARAEGQAAPKGKGKGRGGPAGPIPMRPDGKTVDFSGIWNGGGPIGDIRQGLPAGEELPLLPEENG